MIRLCFGTFYDEDRKVCEANCPFVEDCIKERDDERRKIESGRIYSDLIQYCVRTYGRFGGIVKNEG
jgi:hypothetical protein